MNILELPSLSIGLFGSDKSFDHNLTNNQIKNYCTDENLMPYIIDFFMKKSQPEAKEINDIFMKCCEVKCMNCIYMRTKMRYIYDKNSELKPIVKVLMNLVETETVQSQFEKKATQKNLNYVPQKGL